MKNLKKLIKEKFPAWDYERLEKIDDGYNANFYLDEVIETIYFLLCNKKGYYALKGLYGEEKGRYKRLKDAKRYYCFYQKKKDSIIKYGSMDVKDALKELLSDEVLQYLQEKED